MRLSLLSAFGIAIACLTSACQKGDAESLATNPEPPAERGRNLKVIHIYVALCDNASQSIAPVPKRIGNGDDPANNLYWGCSDGAKPIFSKSPLWKKISSGKVEGKPEILERIVFSHTKQKAILVIDAWRGSKIEPCLTEFCQALAGQQFNSLEIEHTSTRRQLNISGGADLVGFIGHNGLMDFHIPELTANPNRKGNPDTLVLCCKSHRFFEQRIQKAGATPLVLTATNMYPGAFILRDVLEGWFKNEKPSQLRLRAAKAYAKNQSISTKSALSVFAPLH